MSAKKKRGFKVRRGNSHVTVYRWTHPGSGKLKWRFGYEDEGRERHKTCATRDEAVVAAEKYLEEKDAGSLLWMGLSKERRDFLGKVDALVKVADEGSVLDFLRSRSKSAEVGHAVGRYMAHKEAEAGELTPHLANVKRDLEKLVARFSGKDVTDIAFVDLLEWFDKRTKGLSGASKRLVRSALTGFWRWALVDGIAGNEVVTVAEKLPKVPKKKGEVVILSRYETEQLLTHVEEEWRPWAVLGAFAGMRPEEIVPKKDDKKAGKRGILREELDWRFSVIRVPACVSKVGKPRVIPMSPTLKAWLAWAGVEDGQTGVMCARNPSEARETTRLGKLEVEVDGKVERLFPDGWPKNPFRHTFGSMRNAVVRSLNQVAEELGTSVDMMDVHYHNPRAEEEGEHYFELVPSVLFCSVENEVIAESLAVEGDFERGKAI